MTKHERLAPEPCRVTCPAFLAPMVTGETLPETDADTAVLASFLRYLDARKPVRFNPEEYQAVIKLDCVDYDGPCVRLDCVEPY